MRGETPERIHPALNIPASAITYSGIFGKLTATTSPFLKPWSINAFANEFAYLSTSPYAIS